jgi:hypothetical protein
MDQSALLIAQITDFFRIGLLVGLLFTVERTKAQTGIIVPVLAGLAFVAFIIPTTMPMPGVALWQAVVSGLVANAIIFAAIWLVWSAFQRLSRK